MKHAILIIAHSDIPHLKRLVGRFTDPSFYIFIHWDKKFEESRPEPWQSNIQCLDSVYKVNWGSWGIVQATWYLLQKALEHPDGIEYFHLISGADELLRPQKEFLDFFEGKNKSYLTVCPFKYREENPNWEIDEVMCHHDLCDIDLRCSDQSVIDAYWDDIKRQCEEKTDFNPIPPYTRYCGQGWWSMYRDCSECVVEHLPELEPFEKRTKLPDLKAVQTILMNNGMTDKIDRDYLRYVHWDPKPDKTTWLKILDESDFEAAYNETLRNPRLFARKVDSEKSKRFFELIDKKFDWNS